MPGRDDRDDDPGGGVVVAIQRVKIAEVHKDVRELDERIDQVEEDVRENTGRIADLRVAQARTEGHVAHLVSAYERAASVATSQVLTDLEVKKADALARIKNEVLEKKHRRAIRREFLFKLIAMGSGGAALLWSIIQSRC
jgi:hypothetical protein